MLAHNVIWPRSLMAIGFALWCGSSAVSAGPIQMQQADEQYRVGRFEAAERLYQEAVDVEPENPRAWEMLGSIALWRNDLANAEALFAKADQHRGWLARHWPLNSPYNVHRALVHARAGRTREAAALLERAAGPLPLGPFRELKIRSRQLALFDGKAPYRVEGPVETVLPFVVTDPLPVVLLAVNGSPPAEFAIDTGGEGLVLDCAFARMIGAQMIGQVGQEYAGGKSGTTGYGKVDTAQLGDITVHDVPVSCIDMQPIGQTVFGGRSIRGILGTGLLMQFLATLDYPQGRLLLRQYGEAPTASRASEPGRRFPMWLVESHLIFVEGSVNNLEPRLMFIDTGLAGAGFHASKEILARAGVAVDWSKARLGAGGGGLTKAVEVTVAQVRLGQGEQAVQHEHLRGVAFEQDLSLFNGALGFDIGGLVSHQFFRDHVVTFDFRHMQLRMQR